MATASLMGGPLDGREIQVPDLPEMLYAPDPDVRPATYPDADDALRILCYRREWLSRLAPEDQRYYRYAGVRG